jgi:hypothetical protein
MSRPAPTRSAHQDFCLVEGWERVKNARGGKGSDHVKFEFALPDGKILRTKVSHPVNRDTYGASIWSEILRCQLDVAEADFWACVHDKVKPPRGIPQPRREALPAGLVSELITRVGLAEQEVAAMTRQEAIDRMNRYWTAGS